MLDLQPLLGRQPCTGRVRASTPSYAWTLARTLAATMFLSGLLLVAAPALLGTQAAGQADELEDGREDEAAPGELVTDRPDVTESTSIVWPGWMQVESGASLAGEPGGAETLSLAGTLLRFGVSRRVEARLAWDGVQSVDAEGSPAGGEQPAVADADVSGAADAEASIKVLIVERRGARPDVALLPAVTLPVGDDAFTSDGFDPGVKALMGNDLNDRVTWGANAGVAWPTEQRDGRESRPRLLSWSLSSGIGLTDRLSAFLEYFGEDPGGDPAAHAVDGGLTLLVSPNLQLDASGGVGLDERSPDWFAGGGLAFRLGF